MHLRRFAYKCAIQIDVYVYFAHIRRGEQSQVTVAEGMAAVGVAAAVMAGKHWSKRRQLTHVDLLVSSRANFS